MLYSKDLFDPIELVGVKPIETKMEDWKKLDQKMLDSSDNALDRRCHHIAQETNAYTLWTKRDNVLVKDVAEQGVANEEAGEFDAQEWEFYCRTHERVLEFGESAGQCRFEVRR